MAMMAYDERRILEMLHEDDISRRRAFEAIVRNFSEQLYWQIRHMVLSHDDANDILQNTFIKAWTNLDSFMGYSRLSTWLYRVPLETDNDGELSIAEQLESDPWFDGDLTERQLQEAIATLPDKQRMVFNMKYFNEMKYEEISEVLGTTVGALKASFHIAVKKIEEYFNKID